MERIAVVLEKSGGYPVAFIEQGYRKFVVGFSDSAEIEEWFERNKNFVFDTTDEPDPWTKLGYLIGEETPLLVYHKIMGMWFFSSSSKELLRPLR